MDTQKFLGLLEEVLTRGIHSATKTLRTDYYPLPESLTILLQLILSDQSSPLRQLAATQARNLVPKHWKRLPAAQKSQFRQQLLHCTLHEEERLLRHAVSRVISTVAKIDFENGEWQDFIDVLLRAANNANVRQREVGTYLLFASLEPVEDAPMHRFQDIFTTLLKTIRDPESAEVRITTMLAIGRLVEALDKDHDKPSLRLFQQVIPQMVAVLKQAVNEGDEVRTAQAFETFHTLLECNSSVLNRYFGDLVHFMINLAAQQTMDEDARTQALSFLMQCIGYRKKKIRALKVGGQVTLRCLEIACELGDASEDEEEVNTPRAALALLDEMAAALPPSQVVVPLLHVLGPYVNSPDSDRRQAGIMALGMCVEGAPEFISTQLKEILLQVIRLIDDSDPRVRRAAMECVMRLAEELPEDLGKEHKKLMGTIVGQMDIAMKSMTRPDDKQNLDIIKTSVTCIDVIVQGMDTEDIKPYLPELMLRLSKLVSSEIYKIKVAAISAMGAVAACAEEGFSNYFKETMESLCEYAGIKDSTDEQNDSTKEQLNLRCYTCDAIANIALAVGPQSFKNYLEPLMKATKQALLLNHPQLKETSLIFWGTMAKAYKNEFQPFLLGVTEVLFEILKTKETPLEVDLGDEANDLAGQEITIGGRKIKISALTEDVSIEAEDIEDLDDEAAAAESDDWMDELTVVSALDREKETVIEVLGEILGNATQCYIPYMEETIKLVCPLLDDSYEGIRRVAVSTLFRAYTACWNLQPDSIRNDAPGLPMDPEPSSEIKELGKMIIEPTLALWAGEEDSGTVTEINRSLADTLKATGPALIADTATLKDVTEILVMIITKAHDCQNDSDDEDEEDEGEEDEEDENEEDEEEEQGPSSLVGTSESDWVIVDTALDVVIGIANALGETFGQLWPIFEEPILALASSKERFERSTSIGTIAECIKAMGISVTPFTNRLLKLLLESMGDNDNDSEVKSNAAYGIGLLQQGSRKDKEILKAFPTILSRLEPLLEMDEARAKDNAAGCVSRMIMRHPSHIPIQHVLPALLEILPLKSDFDENVPVYDMIIKLYQESNPTMIALTPSLLPILAEVMAPMPPGQLKDTTRNNLTELVQFLATKQPAEVRKYEGLAALV